MEQWLFPDAPRFLAVQAIEKIPELLEALLKSAGDMSEKIAEKAKEVDAMATGIGSVIYQPTSRGLSPGDGFVGTDNLLRNNESIVPAGALARAAQAHAKVRK